MRNKNLVFSFILFGIFTIKSQNNYKKDFLYLWNEINENYAYFDKKTTDWDAVKKHYEPLTDTVSHPYYFTLFLEKVLLNLYDPHTHLRVSTPQSIRLTSSGLDFWVEKDDRGFYISEVRQGAKANTLIKAGDRVLKLNDLAINKAITPFIGTFVDKKDPAVITYAVNLCLGGDYKIERNLTLERNGKEIEVNLGISEYPVNENNLITSKKLKNNIGYIKIENSLGNTDLINAFNEALDQLLDTKALILDLRNTSSGGDSQVAKPILGRFVNSPTPYQKHQNVASGKSWTEIIEPKKPYYDKKVCVLVNRWTGSMGEGFTIGMDAFKNSVTIGTKMTGLLGANYTIELPDNKYKVNIVHEKLFHVDGTPREDYTPAVLIDARGAKEGQDLYIEKALDLIQQ